jgi:hypothetical protein
MKRNAAAGAAAAEALQPIIDGDDPIIHLVQSFSISNLTIFCKVMFVLLTLLLILMMLLYLLLMQ